MKWEGWRHTNRFSGANITEICQHACKYAIRESIEKVILFSVGVNNSVGVGH